MAKNHIKNSGSHTGSGSGYSTKSNQFILVVHPTCPPNFIQIRPQLFDTSSTQTDKQTDTKTTSFHFRRHKQKYDFYLLNLFQNGEEIFTKQRSG